MVILLKNHGPDSYRLYHSEMFIRPKTQLLSQNDRIDMNQVPKKRNGDDEDNIIS